MLNLILFGPPGAGKGTQSEKIVIDYQLYHISTGNILREEVKNQTALGLAAQQIMESGKLVSDDIILGMVENVLKANMNTAKGFIFDGFPRTTPQAEGLANLLKKLGLSFSGVVSLTVDEPELIQRLLKRALDSGRKDDTEEVIKKRQEVYRHETMPLLEYYKNQNLLHEINGMGEIEEIYQNIQQTLKKLSA